MKFLLQMLTWWNNQSIGTQLFTWRNGVLVGEDDQGNKFYTDKAGKKRWVIFNGEIEASRIEPDWHGWLHHTYDNTPVNDPLKHKPWEKPHRPNLTGTDEAYHPPGSMYARKPVVMQDYESWQPEG